MHTSRFAGFIIDCNTSDLKAAAEFWGAALRMRVRPLPAEEGEKYVGLDDGDNRLHIEVQKVEHPSRVHLDIKSDDVPAEVARLEALGARPVGKVHTRDTAQLAELLDDTVTFQSPAVHAPQSGKAITQKYLEAAMRVLFNEHFRYVDEWRGGRSAVLEFETRLGDVEVNGVDLIWWNDSGRITRFKVMVRPVKALQTLVPLMARELQT
jgi:uncharacterized protein YndB with AHSA1/START domain